MAKPSQEYDALERAIEAAGGDVDDHEDVFDVWVEKGYTAASAYLVRLKEARRSLADQVVEDVFGKPPTKRAATTKATRGSLVDQVAADLNLIGGKR